MRFYYRLLFLKSDLDRLNYLLFTFTVLFAFFTIAPVFLDGEFVFYPLIKDGDILDLFTPIILIPLYWLLFKIRLQSKPTPKETLVFLIFVAMWVQGQGMHLAANSIGHLINDLADTNDIKTLTHFYDEILSHYWWHFGGIGLSSLLIYRQWQHPFINQPSGLKWAIGAGIIHGFNYFVDVVESATTPLGVPFSIVVVIFVVLWGQKRLQQQPVLAFFFTTYLVACLFFLGWGIYHGGLPEFSAIGII